MKLLSSISMEERSHGSILGFLIFDPCGQSISTTLINSSKHARSRCLNRAWRWKDVDEEDAHKNVKPWALESFLTWDEQWGFGRVASWLMKWIPCACLWLYFFYEREESFDGAYFESYTAKGIHFVQKSINWSVPCYNSYYAKPYIPINTGQVVIHSAKLNITLFYALIWFNSLVDLLLCQCDLTL